MKLLHVNNLNVIHNRIECSHHFCGECAAKHFAAFDEYVLDPGFTHVNCPLPKPTIEDYPLVRRSCRHGVMRKEIASYDSSHAIGDVVDALKAAVRQDRGLGL